MWRYADRAKMLPEGAGDVILKLMLERSTHEQWAEWLRAPLEHAAGTADHDLVQTLLRAGADCRAGWKGCHGMNLLHAAAKGGNSQVVTALIRAGAEADINVPYPGTAGTTPLHLAIIDGKEAAAGALIMAGADVNLRDATTDTPLNLAIKGGLMRVCRDLLIGGADPNVKGSDFEYPLHLAAGRGQDEVVLALVQRGVDLDLLDLSDEDDEKTPLVAALVNDHDSTVKALLAGGAKANARMNADGQTALHIAAQYDKTASITALVEGGADVEDGDRTGSTPLDIAASLGSRGAMLTLLQLGADINTEDNVGRTPLHIACMNGHTDAADMLLRQGADETIQDFRGETPSEVIPDIAQAPERNRPGLERLTKLLAYAPQDRAWRRRGFLVMCRAHRDRLRLTVEAPDTTARAIGQRPQCPSYRARRGQVEAEVVGGAHGGIADSSCVCASRRAKSEGAGGGFDGVMAWLMSLNDGDVFSAIVGFL